MTVTDPTPTRHSLWHRLYHGETDVDFVGRFRRWALLSTVLIAVGLLSLVTRGLNLGIDFEGGVVWETPAGEASVDDALDAMNDEGLEGLTVQSLTSDDDTRLRVEAEPVDIDKAEAVTNALAELTGSEPDEVSLTSVGPSWGEEISEKALRALIIFLVVITLYITLRFEFRMAIPTLVALVHDILFTIGVYSVVGFEVTPATVIALLTILGFSIYDGIVVFDKVDENTKLVGSKEGMTYSDMVNLSLNQVLMRSLNTSITALLPVGSLLVLGSFILGATTLQEFALALLIGLFAGAYSSIFIASPMLAVLKEREPQYRDVKARLSARQAAAAKAAEPRTPAAVAATGALTGDEPPDDGLATAERPAPAPTPPGSPPAIPPRPRKKTRKRR
jgi:preprotein translocase subunit SecF